MAEIQTSALHQIGAVTQVNNGSVGSSGTHMRKARPYYIHRANFSS